MDGMRKATIVLLLLVTAAAVWRLADINRDIFNFAGAGEPAAPIPAGGPEPEYTAVEGFVAFFTDYRLQRDRVRAGEIEMLNRLIDSENVSAEGKREAEKQLLALIRLTEQEMVVENMLKASGYNDAVFFYRDGAAKVVVQAETLSEQDFLLIAEIVGNAAGVPMEKVTVAEHSGQQSQ